MKEVYTSSMFKCTVTSLIFLWQVQNAIEYLKIIEALDENEDLTILGNQKYFTFSSTSFVNEIVFSLYICLFSFTGRYLTMLPMEPKLGKMLILGVIFNCLDPILSVVAGLSVRDPFLAPFEKKDVRITKKIKYYSVIVHVLVFLSQVFHQNLPTFIKSQFLKIQKSTFSFFLYSQLQSDSLLVRYT